MIRDTRASPSLPRHCALAACSALLATTAPWACAAEFGAGWTGDFGTVLSGGLVDDDPRHLGLVEVTFDHGFAIAGRESALHLSLQHVYGGGFSAHEVGDMQTVSNIDADDGTRLLEAWIDVPVTDHTTVLAGRYDLNSEFDVIAAGGLFLSSSQGIGPDISQTGAAGPSIFPRTALGIRVQHANDAAGTLRFAAMDVEPSDTIHHQSQPFAGGSMFAVEYQFPVQRALVTTGAWRFGRTRNALEDPAQHDSEYGGYVSVESPVAPNVVAYARIGLANQEVCRIGRYFGGGIVHTTGLLPNVDDTIGLALGYAINGNGYRDAMRNEGTPVEAGEQDWELTWRIPLGEHVVLQPDLQYVVDPDTNPQTRNALVAILRVEVSL